MIIVLAVISIFDVMAVFFISSFVDLVMSNSLNVTRMATGEEKLPGVSELAAHFFVSPYTKQLFLVIFIILFVLCTYLVFFTSKKDNYAYKSAMVKITEDIEIPSPSGQAQHGSAWFTEPKEFKKVFENVEVDFEKEPFKKLLEDKALTEEEIKQISIKNGGLLLGKERLPDNKIFLKLFPDKYLKKANKETLYYIGEDTHSLIIGSTRCGKSRCVVLESIGLQALAGENMILSDPKGELYHYTNKYLENLGYEVIALDFNNIEMSTSYNFLQPIIDLVNEDKISKAMEVVADFVEALVGKQTGEPIWHNGESSVIAFSILAVVMENKDHPEFQNLTNVYHFISNMCRTVFVDGNPVFPLQEYLDTLPDNHPVKAEAGISEIAPSKTRSSFFTSALATLRLFANPLIYNISNKTEFDMNDMEKKRAIFMILPDEKTTFYKVATLFVNSYYMNAVNIAKNKYGNRLPRRLNYILDEFGNFPPLPDFPAKITVGGGYGIIFNLFIQSYSQMINSYDEKVAKIIEDNTENLIYLKAVTTETRNIVADKLGEYTVATTSDSTSISNSKDGGSYSTSTNLTARKLLTSEELGKLKRPHSLIVTPSDKAVFYAPDLSEYHFNKLFGLGDKAHNTEVIRSRKERRATKEMKDVELWGIWNKYNGTDDDFIKRLNDEFENAINE